MQMSTGHLLTAGESGGSTKIFFPAGKANRFPSASYDRIRRFKM
jgi:hypothetical protein